MGEPSPTALQSSSPRQPHLLGPPLAPDGLHLLSPHSLLLHHWPPRAESIGDVSISPSKADPARDVTEELATKKNLYHCPEIPHMLQEQNPFGL